jgi:DeoR/GlpR family transcriptional regulator of sugar metabolism
VSVPSTRRAPILARQRQARILEAVQQGGGVRVGELAAALGVSDMTIRRDLAALARQGLLDKVHGGATKINQAARGEPADAGAGRLGRRRPLAWPPSRCASSAGGRREGAGGMLAQQRQALILEHVERDGAVRVSELTKLLSVSDMTVRRDLDALARRGLLDKVHAGATLRQDASANEPGFEAKSARELAEKDAIGRRAAALVKPGSAIALTAGTTTFALATRLGAVPDLTVVTNSIRVAEALHKHARPDRTVILTGGIRTPSDALVGPIAVATIRSLHVDVVFMGVHGMSERTGYTTPNLMEAEANRELVHAAGGLVVVADHTKWDTLGLSRIVELDAADTLVTDAGLPEAAREVLARTVADLVIVDVPAAPARDPR